MPEFEDYTVIVTHDEGYYNVYLKELPNILSFGLSKEEAIKKLKAVFEDMKEDEGTDEYEKE